MSNRGLTRERSVKQALQESGWVPLRIAKGPVDVVACRPTQLTASIPLAEVRFIQIKSTAQSPYERFGPAERQHLLELATEAGATAWLIWWPPRKGWRWISSDEWPQR